MGLSGEKPLGEVKIKAPSSDYHQVMSPVAARQAEVARDYLKRAARTDELNGHPPGTDGLMVTALKGYNGGQVPVFVMGAFAEMPGVCEPHLWHHHPRSGADPHLVLQRRF